MTDNKVSSAAERRNMSSDAKKRSPWLKALRGDQQAVKELLRDMLPAFIQLHCNKLLWQHKKLKNDPHYAIEAFLLCHDRGLHPPDWALNCFAEKFGEYHESEGTKSLDRIFGFGRNKGKRFKKQTLEERNLALALDIYKLTLIVGLSDEDASAKVALKHDLAEETVHDLYRREWKKILEAEDKDFMREIVLDLPTKD